MFKFTIVHTNPTSRLKWPPRWPKRWPPKPINDHNYVNIHTHLIILVAIHRFQGAKNTFISSDIV